MVRRLIVTVGFPWAVRTFAFIVLGGLLICIAILRLRPNLKRRGALFDVKHFRDIPYVAFCIGEFPISYMLPVGPYLTPTNNSISAFALMIGSVYIPFFFFESYAIRLGVDPEMSFYLLSVMNAGSLVGRLAPNWLADKYGGISVMLPFCLMSVLILFFIRFVHDLPGLIVTAIIYGFVSGGMVSLPPATIANLTDDLSEYGTRMGMGYTIASLGALIGNPIGGAVQRPQGSSTEAVQREFQGTWIVAGSFMLAAVAALMVSRYSKFGMTMHGKC